MDLRLHVNEGKSKSYNRRAVNGLFVATQVENLKCESKFTAKCDGYHLVACKLCQVSGTNLQVFSLQESITTIVWTNLFRPHFSRLPVLVKTIFRKKKAFFKFSFCVKNSFSIHLFEVSGFFQQNNVTIKVEKTCVKKFIIWYAFYSKFPSLATR